ncbi:MAG: hypothetical protein LHW56_07445 [Candidatus Cloacimonetes bacterium]|nr:hypothetical protein [Candidatus Cloacimonadota bacterium]MDY0172728.1 hypothetical protein [Candidatus Cloacimonadaceae bacterium]
MGTQQILLIVLSVIIVGAAIAVGITMFNNQAYSANRSALAADAQSFGTQIIQYYKTPISQGGNGRVLANMTKESIAGYIGWTGMTTGDTPTYDGTTTTENGKFTITTDKVDAIVITGVGNEIKGDKNPQVVTTITLSTGDITSELSEVAIPVVTP